MLSDSELDTLVRSAYCSANRDYLENQKHSAEQLVQKGPIMIVQKLLIAGLFACIISVLFLEDETYNMAHERVTDILSGKDHANE